MTSRILRNRSTFGFYSPQQKNSINGININELEVYKDRILKLKIELNKKNFECQELRIMYNKLDKVYKSNLNLVEKLINEANNNIINTNLSFDKDKDKEKELISLKKYHSPKNTSKTLESIKNTTFNNNNNNFLYLVKKNHLNIRLQQEISQLKNEINEKDNIINNLKNNANVLKYKELDKKFAKMYQELIQTRENNEKLETYCLNLTNKINFYKEKIKKLNYKNILIEDEKEALKKKIAKFENILDNTNTGDQNIMQKKNTFVKNGNIEILKEKMRILERENKELKENLNKNQISNSSMEDKKEDLIK